MNQAEIDEVGEEDEEEEESYSDWLNKRIKNEEIKALENFKPLQTDCYNWLKKMTEQRQAGRIIGISGVGKTYVCSIYRDINRQDNRFGKRVMYLKFPPKCTDADFFNDFIESLRCWKPMKESIRESRKRIYQELKDNKTEMIIFDDADRLSRFLAEISDIFDLLNISTILVGTKKLEAIIKKDDRLSTRFRSNFTFKE